MIAPRWRKVVRDLLSRPGRSALAVVAMAAGIFEIGAMLDTYALLSPELRGMYALTKPAAATLTTDRVTDALVDSVRRVPGVGAAEARPLVLARVRVGDEWAPIFLYAVRDFDRQQLDLFEPERGAWPPAASDVLLERSALGFARVDVGDTLVVRTAGGQDRAVRVTGTVHTNGLPPAWMEHAVPGFVAWDSPLRGGTDESAQIRIRVADHALDEGHVREVADSVQALLERGGHAVARVQVPTPGRHPHADQMEAFLFLILAFGILSFALSAVLVASMIQALMAEQVQQVGMMKAIGATSRQVAGVYLGQVAILAVMALAIGVPAGLWLGRAYAEFSAGLLNTDITHAPFPWAMVAAQVVVGLGVPLAVALVPVRRAAAITVREALSDAPRPGGLARALDRRLANLAWVPRPLALTLRTTLARRGRLALTVVLLAIGGGVFLSALDVAAAWRRGVNADFAARGYDLSLRLSQPTAVTTIDSVLARVPGVAHAEAWAAASPYLIGANGVPGNAVTLIGMEPTSSLLHLRVIDGRWLRAGDRDGAVVNRAVVARDPAIAVGKPIVLRLRGRDVAFPVVGVVRELNPSPTVYAVRGAVLAARGESPAVTRAVEIVTRRHDPASVRATAGEVEAAFAAAGLEVGDQQRLGDSKQAILDHLLIILSILTTASLVVVFVGALGLASTLTLDVVRRTREIGVLGAIGATPGTIAFLVWFEAMAIGLLSWTCGLVVAAPISWALESACGNIFFKTPLDFYMSPPAAATWLGLVVVLATVSSIAPARRAARFTVREALTYG